MTNYNPVTRDQERHLIRQWQDHGCERARRAMFDAFRPLIESRAAKYQHIDFDDVFQQACIGFCKAIDTFDLDRGNRFATHLIWQIRGAIPSRNDTRYFRNRGLEVTALDTPFDLDGNTMKDLLVDPVAPDYDRRSVCRGLDAAMSRLPQRERVILTARANDTTLKTLGEHYGVSKEYIRQLEAKALDKLRCIVPKGYRYYLED